MEKTEKMENDNKTQETLDLILKPLLGEDNPHDPYTYLIKLWTNADDGREVDRVNMEKTLSVNISANLQMQDLEMPQSIAIVSDGGNLYDLDVEQATPKVLIASVYDATMDIDEEQLFRNENPTGVYAVRMNPGDLRRKPKPEIPCHPDEELLNRLTQLLTNPGTATPKPGQVRKIWSRMYDTPTLDEIFQASSMAIQDGSHLSSSPVKKKTSTETGFDLSFTPLPKGMYMVESHHIKLNLRKRTIERETKPNCAVVVNPENNLAT